MLAKYHLLLQQESTRQASSSEEVMLARFWDSEERQNLAKEKEDFQKGVVHELPPLSEEWAAKYEEIYDSKPPPGVVGETVKVEEDEKPEGVKQEDPFTVTDEVKPVVVEATTGTKRPLQQDDVIAKIEEEVFFRFDRCNSLLLQAVFSLLINEISWNLNVQSTFIKN